jgi:Flp pilus assembly protein TadG
MIRRILRAFAGRREGSVSVVTAVSLPILIAITGFVAEYGNGLLHKMENQRIADAAAFAAATAYGASSSNSITSAVDAVATINGVPTSAISATLATSPTGDGNQAVEVSVTTQSPLLLSKVLGNSQANLNVTATSYAEIKGGAPGCIIALNAAGSGVALSGGTSVSAAACAIASNASISVPCGPTITTIAADYGTTAPSQPCNGIQPPTGKSLSIRKSTTTDPIAGTTQLASATATLTTLAGLTYPGALSSVPTGTDIDFGKSSKWPGELASVDGGACTSPGLVSGVFTITCTGNGPFNFGALSFGGGVTYSFVATGGAPVWNFSSVLNLTGGDTYTFSPGTFNFAGGVETGGGVHATFGAVGTASTYNFGSGSFSCNSSTGYSICNTGTNLTFAGPSQFTIQGGVYNSGGETLVLGNGTTNSFDIGKANDGDSFEQGGGATTTFGDATGTGDVFQMQGNLDVAAGGGSCLTLSAATNHYIGGYFATAGGTTMGAGVYTVNGYFALGPSGGGDVTCNGTAVGLNANNVSLVIGGANVPTSGNNANQSFYMGAGFSNVTLLAPTTGPTANLAVVGPQTGTNGATLAEGASGADFSGAFYFPTEAVSMNGGSGLGSFGANQCLMVVGSQVSLSGGATLASSCQGFGAGTTATVVLVQ